MYGMSEDQIVTDGQAAALIYNLIMRHAQAHTPIEEIALFRAIAALDIDLYNAVIMDEGDDVEEDDEFDETDPEDETSI